MQGLLQRTLDVQNKQTRLYLPARSELLIVLLPANFIRFSL